MIIYFSFICFVTFSITLTLCTEKHKVYHQKDEALIRDGFKKFMKYEKCRFAGCVYSQLSNHIHCIRPGCFLPSDSVYLPTVGPNIVFHCILTEPNSVIDGHFQQLYFALFVTLSLTLL